jgi:hypothetical protein
MSITRYEEVLITSNAGNPLECAKTELGFNTKASEYQGNSAKIVE